MVHSEKRNKLLFEAEQVTFDSADDVPRSDDYLTATAYIAMEAQ